MKKVFGIFLAGCIMVSSAFSVFAEGVYQGFEDTELSDETAVTVCSSQIFEGTMAAKVSRKWTFAEGADGQPGAFLKLKTPKLTNTSLSESESAVVAEGWFYDNYDPATDVAKGSPVLPMLYFETEDNSWRLSVGAVRDNTSYNYYGYSFAEVPDESADWSANNLTGYNDYILETNPHWSWYHCMTSAWGWRARSKGWHHVQVVVENGVTSVYFDGEKDPRIGSQVGSNSKPIISVMGMAHPGTDTYKRFASPVNTDYLSNYESYYDSFAVYTKGTVFINVTLGENGSVSDENSVLKNGCTLIADTADTKEFTVTPDSGYRVASFTLDGTEYPVNNNKVAISCSGLANDISANKHSLAVTFEKAEDEVPSVYNVVTGTPSLYSGLPSNVIYAKVSGSPEAFGFEFSNGKAVLPLKAESKNSDGAFGIRVYGKVLENGSYTMCPFVTYRDKAGKEITDKGDETALSFKTGE